MTKRSQAKTADIKDSRRDQEKMQPETVVIDMPEVKDIPGQENITPPRIREMEDITISSADEEGEGLLDDLNSEDEQVPGNAVGSGISAGEKKLLQQSAQHPRTEENTDFKRMVLDEKDADGDWLNEKSIRQDRSGEDLDIPGAGLDDEDERDGAEDEENNIYSQRD